MAINWERWSKGYLTIHKPSSRSIDSLSLSAYISDTLTHCYSTDQPSSPTETPHKGNYISICKLDEYDPRENQRCSLQVDKWLKWRSSQCKRSGCFGSSCAIGNFFPPLTSKWILRDTHFVKTNICFVIGYFKRGVKVGERWCLT